MQQVHLRVNDAGTGQLTPVRLRITDAAGNYFAPFGRLADFATGVDQDVGGSVLIEARKWAYIDGACEILLPPGQLRIEIAKGPEYKPIDEEITLLAGKMSLRFTMERWCDSRKEGWFSGDARAHFLSPDAALLEGQAEDLAVVNVLVKEASTVDPQGQAHTAIPNILSFSGQQFARHSTSCGVAVNTQNVHHLLGTLGLLNCHRVVYPLTGDSIAWTLDDWCGQCHRKNGLVVWTDSMQPLPEFRYGEPLVGAILGDVDAFEVPCRFKESPFDPLDTYYALLNAGIVVPLVGASAKDSNRIALGSQRTYAYLGTQQEMTYAGWIEAIRTGKTYVTNGPLLHFTVDGVVPGRAVAMGGDGLQIHAEAQSITPFDRLEVCWCGAPLAQVIATKGPPYRAALDYRLPPKCSGYLTIRCLSDGARFPGGAIPHPVLAHSSAVAVRIGESAPFTFEGEDTAITKDLETLLAWANRNDAPRLAGRVEEARAILAQLHAKK